MHLYPLSTERQNVDMNSFFLPSPKSESSPDMAVCQNPEDWICGTKSKPAVPVPVSSRQWYFVFFGRFCLLSFNRDVLSLLHGPDPSKSPWAWQAGQGTVKSWRG